MVTVRFLMAMTCLQACGRSNPRHASRVRLLRVDEERMAKIAIVVGNPMHDSYSDALGKAYLRGAESGGHSGTLLPLAGMKFDLLREGYRRLQPLEPDLVAAREALLACNHLVLVFPLWAGDMP